MQFEPSSGVRQRYASRRLLLSSVCAISSLLPLYSARKAGEPQYVAIRGAKASVSGPPVENAPLFISLGLTRLLEKKTFAIQPESVGHRG